MRVADDENEEPFLRLILRYPLATCLLVKYCQHNDLPMLKRIHRSFGRCERTGGRVLCECVGVCLCTRACVVCMCVGMCLCVRWRAWCGRVRLWGTCVMVWVWGGEVAALRAGGWGWGWGNRGGHALQCLRDRLRLRV
jgi:hypothetical protein